MTVRILVGDVRARLRELKDESVHCVVSSPPYWGLRDYGTARWEGGDPDCEHTVRPPDTQPDTRSSTLEGSKTTLNHALEGYRDVCGRCGARRVDQQLGLEPTPQEHVAQMVDVFREVRRVLRPDGVCWVNYGDSYATAVNGRSAADTKATGNDDRTFRDKPFSTVAGGLKPKDLCMVPFRFAIAMQADGWYLRSVLPWVKRNPMPESIEDRPATAIEQVFMFAKSERYWFDAQAVRQKRVLVTKNRQPYGWASGDVSHKPMDHNKPESGHRKKSADKQRGHGRRHQGFNERWDSMERKQQIADGRSFRNTDLFYESLRAGSHGLISGPDGAPLALDVAPMAFEDAHFATFPPKLIAPLILAGCPEGGVVLDPFGGAGTTGLVAMRLRRSAVLIELNPEYAEIARRRIDGDAPMFDQRTILEAAQ